MVHLWLHSMEYVTFVDIIWIHGAWFNKNIYDILLSFSKYHNQIKASASESYAVSMKLNVW